MKTLVAFDYNNLAMRLVSLPMVRLDTPNPHMDFWAYLMFTDIYNFLLRVGADTEGPVDVLLACDSTSGYWRREVYPPYKMDRAKRRSASTVDWQLVYSHMDAFLEKVAANLPWAVVRVPKCEADDVIAIVCLHANPGKVVIHSTDVDFVQLISDNVEVYNPLHGYATFPGLFKVGNDKKQCASVAEFLDISVLTGQGGKDNVYNIITPTSWEPTEEKKRKPGFGVAKATKLIESNKLTEFLEENDLLGNLERNRQLIDLERIPENYQQDILETFRARIEALSDVSLRKFLANYDWPSFSANDEVLQEMSSIMSILSEKEVADETELIDVTPDCDEAAAAEAFCLSF